MTNEEVKDKENQFIDGLFDNEHFQEKLAEFIAENLKIDRRYDAYTGNYDDMSFWICGRCIEIDESSYGI